MFSFGCGKITESAENKNIVFIISTVSLAISVVLWTLVKEHTITKASEGEILSAFTTND